MDDYILVVDCGGRTMNVQVQSTVIDVVSSCNFELCTVYYCT